MENKIQTNSFNPHLLLGRHSITRTTITIPSKFTQSLISQLVVVVGSRWVAFWKAESELYRLVVVSRRNIGVLSIISTREGVRIRIWSPESKSKLRILTKEKEIDTLTSTAVNNVSIFISNNDNNDSSFAYGSLTSTLHHHRRHIIMINYH